MKNILSIVILGVMLSFAAVPAVAEEKTKRVCVDVKDKQGKVVKDAKGKTKQNCRDVRKHRKLDGKAIPKK